jgi:two-component system cell cycle sensor histidine kinase/response regulator CckA
MSKKANRKLLLVEDNPGDARLLREMLIEQGLDKTDVTHVACMREAEKELAEGEFDIIVLDLGLPDAQGLGAVQRARAAAPRVPLVVLTGLDDESMALQALHAGAQDYLVKGQIETRGLLRGLRYAIERKVLEEALTDEAEQLRASGARLRESKQHLTRAQELAESGSYESDPRTAKTTWSDNLYKIFGVDRASFAIRWESLSELIHPEDRDRVRGGFQSHGAGIATKAFEFRIIRPDGQCRAVIAENTSNSDANGSASVIGTIRDVTSAKAAQERLRALEMQLQHSQKLEALGTLAGGIAHDLNNALVPTIIMTEMVIETHAEDSPERAHLALALAGARRAKELVRRILTFARKETMEKHDLDLATLVSEAMSMLRASLPATIDLITLVEPIPAVFGDGGQLYQVILNLVTNAAQAIGDEPGRITVTVRSARGGSHIELTVADTGHGMDETTSQRIFDPFFTTKAVNEGTGLGLSIVHGIVVAHDGTIAVTSQIRRGSTFSITLPIAGDRQKQYIETVPTAA